MNKDLPHTVLEALRGGNKLEAIKRLRSLTGLGLKESKEWIDAYERGGAPPLTGVQALVTRNPEAKFAHFDKAVAALKSGNKVEAIRIITQMTDVGLAEAKAMVEKIGKEMPAAARSAGMRPKPQIPHRHPGLAPGEVPREGSGQWMGLVVVVAAGVAAAYFFT